MITGCYLSPVYATVTVVLYPHTYCMLEANFQRMSEIQIILRRKLFDFYQSFVFYSSETAISLMKLFQLSSLYGLNHALFSICQKFQNVMDCHNFVSHECHIDGCSRYLNIDFKN